MWTGQSPSVAPRFVRGLTSMPNCARAYHAAAAPPTHRKAVASVLCAWFAQRKGVPPTEMLICETRPAMEAAAYVSDSGGDVLQTDQRNVLARPLCALQRMWDAGGVHALPGIYVIYYKNASTVHAIPLLLLCRTHAVQCCMLKKLKHV